MHAVFADRGVTENPLSSRTDAALTAGDRLAGKTAERDGEGRPELRENTLEAFSAARRLGADGVELDVRLSADGVAVVHHDAVLPDGRRVAGTAAADLPSWLPTLVSAVEACAGLVVNVELKPDEADGERRLAVVVAEVLAGVAPADPWMALAGGVGGVGTLGEAGGPPQVLVSSFDAPSLAVVRQAVPWLPAGLLIDWRHDPQMGLEEAARLGCASLHPFVTQVDAGLVAACAETSMALHVWTVNADADLRKMGLLGVAAVITDRVGAAVSILHAGA